MINVKEVIQKLEEITNLFENYERHSMDDDEMQAIKIAIAILKEQESIKPNVEYNPAGQPMWCCENCGATSFFEFYRKTGNEKGRGRYRICTCCGWAVKWE